MSPRWSLAAMREMLALAERLRFYDEIEYWKTEIAKREAEEAS